MKDFICFWLVIQFVLVSITYFDVRYAVETWDTSICEYVFVKILNWPNERWYKRDKISFLIFPAFAFVRDVDTTELCGK